MAPQDATKNTAARTLFTSKDARKAIASFAQDTFRNSAISKTRVAEDLVWWHAATCSKVRVWNLVIHYMLYANRLNWSVNDTKDLCYWLNVWRDEKFVNMGCRSSDTPWATPRVHEFFITSTFHLPWTSAYFGSMFVTNCPNHFRLPLKASPVWAGILKKKALSYNSNEVSLNLSHTAEQNKHHGAWC